MEWKLKEKKGDDIMNTLEKCYTSLNVSFHPNYIDRAHRIGLLRADNQSRKKVKSIIRSWKARQLFNKGRQGITLTVRRNQVSLFQLIKLNDAIYCSIKSRNLSKVIQTYKFRL